jgi:hypothetical protein
MLPLVAKDQMSANLALDNEILREVIEKTLEPNVALAMLA